MSLKATLQGWMSSANECLTTLDVIRTNRLRNVEKILTEMTVPEKRSDQVKGRNAKLERVKKSNDNKHVGVAHRR